MKGGTFNHISGTWFVNPKFRRVQAFRLLCVLFYSVISRNLKVEIWLRMGEMSCESPALSFHFSRNNELLSINFFSSDFKLFVKRRLQFHFSHAENVSSKLPKWTLFALCLRALNREMNNLRFEVLSFDLGQKSSRGSGNKFVHIHVSKNYFF